MQVASLKLLLKALTGLNLLLCMCSLMMGFCSCNFIVMSYVFITIADLAVD